MAAVMLPLFVTLFFVVSGARRAKTGPVSKKRGIAVQPSSLTMDIFGALSETTWLTPSGQTKFTFESYGAWGKARVQHVDLPWGSTSFRLVIHENTPSPGKKSAALLSPDVWVSPASAAELWKQVEVVAQGWGIDVLVSIAAPGKVAAASAEWLLDFLAECNGCRIDALAVHDRSCHVEELAGHLNVYRPFALPLWLMEVGCDEHSAATTSKEYMREAVALLEADSIVEKYAWRMEEPMTDDEACSFVSDNGTLSELGRFFASLPAAVDPEEARRLQVAQATEAQVLAAVSNLKGIHYEPQLTGMVFLDTINPILTKIYQRDVRMIAEEVGADTIVLRAPSNSLPDGGSWTEFLDSCHSRNISVIPTFSVKYFRDLGVSKSEMGGMVEVYMDRFLRYFMEGETDLEWGEDYCTNQGGSLHPAVKAWVVDGLPDLEVLVSSSELLSEGIGSDSDATVLARETNAVAIQSASVCLRQMLGDDTIMGIIVSLDTPNAKANTTTFDNSLSLMIDSLELPEYEGNYFQFWVLDMKLPPIALGVQQVLDALVQVVQTNRKPIIPQFGVSAVIPEAGNPAVKTDLQQSLLTDAWVTLRDYFVGSYILFEFSDNWGASENYNSTSCEDGADSVLMQTTCGWISGLIDDTTVVAVEYMGITSHTNWFLNACVEPRWLDVDETAKGIMGIISDGVPTKRLGSFSYLSDDEGNWGSVKTCVMVSFMDALWPASYIEDGVPPLFLVLAALSIFVLCCGCASTRRRVRSLEQSASVNHDMVPHVFDNDIGTDKYKFQRKVNQKAKRKMKTNGSLHNGSEHDGRTPIVSKRRLSSCISQDMNCNFVINAFVGDPWRHLNEIVSVRLSWLDQHKGAHVEALLKNCWAVQQRILEHHVLCEERAAPRGTDRNTFRLAVTNVWARALEGYHLWSSARERDVEPDLENIDMFKEVLMMYTLQAVSEQLCHCPELLNALYHVFLHQYVFRYDALCRALDEYKQNSDPYGGLMLDDVNDGIARSIGAFTPIEKVEAMIEKTTYRHWVKKLIYPQRGITCAVKLVTDFRCFVEIKAGVAYLAYGAFSGDIRWHYDTFFVQFSGAHAVMHMTFEALALMNFFYVRQDTARLETFLRIILGFLISSGSLYASIYENDYSDIIGPVYLCARIVYLLFIRNNNRIPCLRAPQFFPVWPKPRASPLEEQRKLITLTNFKQRLLYWMCVLTFCFVFEVYFVFSVLEGITPHVLCFQRCERLLWRSKCIACYSAIGLLYVMIGSLLCVDVLMGQVLFTCIFGVRIGYNQGISGMRKSSDSAVFLSDTTRGIGKDNSRAGCLMNTVFGPYWRSVWNLLCYQLWKEDLVSMEEADELMRMALKKDADKNRDTPLHLGSLNNIVRERLTFFFASMRFICEDERRRHEAALKSNPDGGVEYSAERKFCHHGIYRIHDVIPMSQVIPAVNEEVILPAVYLQAEDGKNLRWIIGKYPREWQYLTARLSEKDLVNRFVGNSQPPVTQQAVQEIRVWASMRSQTVLRTVNGAVNYHIALEANPNVTTPHSSLRKRNQLEKYVELVWAHQTHGDNNVRDRDVRWTLMEYEEYPIFLVFDLDMVHLTTQDRKVMGRMVRRRVQEELGQPKDDFDLFFEDFPHVSCKAAYKKRQTRTDRQQLVKILGLDKICDAAFFKTQVEEWDPMSVLNLDIVEAAPRRFPLMIGKNKLNMTQGKAGNQLNAMRFSRGFALQAMDANMGSFIGEAFKVSTVLKYFHPLKNARDRVTARMIGFREHIFTVSHGICGDINAVAEWSFGTIIQRVQAWLGVRMHYGHPDFVDLFWARSRGGMSKASPHINLSEDIFAGLNVKNRSERSEHVDILEYEKGREVSFNAASTFLYKISAGNVGVWRSKDLTEVTAVMTTVDQMSFYFATVGYFVSLTIIDCTVYLFLGFHILLALASISLHELGELGAAIASEWIWGPAVFMYLPPLLEGSLEFGGLIEALKRLISGFDPMASMFPAGILYWWMTLIFFTFQNKTKAAAVRQALSAGTASYKATGRPNANTRLTLLDTFLQYRGLHYKDGVTFLFYYVIYRVANLGLAGALPMITIVFSSVCWLVVPTIFSPYPSWKNLCEDVTVFYDFMMRCPADRSRTELLQQAMWLTVSASGKKPAIDVPKTGSKGVPGNLFELLFRDAQDKDQKLSVTWDQDAILCLTSIFRSAVLLAVIPATSTESFEFWCCIWVLHTFLALLFGLFLELPWILALFIGYVLFISRATNFANICLALVLILQLLDTCSHIFMTFSRFSRRLPGRSRWVTVKNVRLGMKVLPGPDWMYDIKPDDGPQNAVQGSSMVGEVTSIEGREEGYCEVRWLSGTIGRYRIASKEATASDLTKYPDYSTIAVEATILLFGKYHLNLLVAFVVLIAHSITSILLIILDLPIFGSLHSQILRLPTAEELKNASNIEADHDKGGKGAPPIAMTEREDNIRVVDLQRGPWLTPSKEPPTRPAPPAHILDDPNYRGAEWKSVCRMKVTKKGLEVLSSRGAWAPTAIDVAHEFKLVVISVENRDGQKCKFDVPLEANSYLLFGFENTANPGPEHFNSIRELLEEDKRDLRDDDFVPEEHVDRVWLPCYTFNVPKALTGVPWRVHNDTIRKNEDRERAERRAIQKMAARKAERYGDSDSDSDDPMMFLGHPSIDGLQAPEIVGLVSDATKEGKRWFPPDTEVVHEGNQIILSQGSVNSFALTWARARFGFHCLGTGFKMVYGVTLPKDSPDTKLRPPLEQGVFLPLMTFLMGFRLGDRSFPEQQTHSQTKELLLGNSVGMLEDLAQLSATCRSAFRTSRMPHLWPHSNGLVFLGIDVDKQKTSSTLLFGFQSEKPQDEALRKFCGMQSTNDLDDFITSKWIPIFNFRVPELWHDKSVIEILRQEEIMPWGIARNNNIYCREIWFAGPGTKYGKGKESFVERFGPYDEIMMPLWSAYAFMKKYYNSHIPVSSEEPPTRDQVTHDRVTFRWDWYPDGK